MPPLASSKRPACAVCAPVNAPRSCPNSSLSMSVGGQRAAVDDDEGPVPARAALVDRPGDELLARAGLAEQQHRRVGGRNLLDAVHDVLQ